MSYAFVTVKLVLGELILCVYFVGWIQRRIQFKVISKAYYGLLQTVVTCFSSTILFILHHT